MPVTININSLSLVHQASGGIAISTVPDSCKTPIIVPVPIPYVNIAMSSMLVNGSTTVFADGGNSVAMMGAEFAMSNGDQAGVLGGVVSSTIMLEAKFITASFNVFIEGRGACRLTDKMLMNHGNTACIAGVLQAPVPGGAPGAASADALARTEQAAAVVTESFKEASRRGTPLVKRCGSCKDI